MMRLMTISVTSSVTATGSAATTAILWASCSSRGRFSSLLYTRTWCCLTMGLPVMRCMGGFDVGKAAVQVHGGGGFGQARVAGGYRFGDGGVFGCGGGEPLGVVGGKPADPDQVHPQARMAWVR